MTESIRLKKVIRLLLSPSLSTPSLFLYTSPPLYFVKPLYLPTLSCVYVRMSARALALSGCRLLGLCVYALACFVAINVSRLPDYEITCTVLL